MHQKSEAVGVKRARYRIPASVFVDIPTGRATLVVQDAWSAGNPA